MNVAHAQKTDQQRFIVAICYKPIRWRSTNIAGHLIHSCSDISTSSIHNGPTASWMTPNKCCKGQVLGCWPLMRRAKSVRFTWKWTYRTDHQGEAHTAPVTARAG